LIEPGDDRIDAGADRYAAESFEDGLAFFGQPIVDPQLSAKTRWRSFSPALRGTWIFRTGYLLLKPVTIAWLSPAEVVAYQTLLFLVWRRR